MSLLSCTEILELIEQGVIQNADPANVNAASLDLVLGNKIQTEINPYKQPKLSLRKREKLYSQEIDITSSGYILSPGEFILAHTKEIFNLPNNISAEYKLKSSMARIGLEHLNAGWCDAGWHGSVLTLELKNMTQFHSIELHEGDKIGQIIFWRHKIIPKEFSYATKGSYNGDKTVSGAKKEKIEYAFTEVDIDKLTCRGGNCE